MESVMAPEMIEQIALANGFKLKRQPDGSMALNPYVFEFARALLVASLTPPAQEQDVIADFINKQEPLGAEFEKVLHNNLDSLYEADEPAECRHGSWNHLSTRGTRKELEEDAEKLRRQVKREIAILSEGW